MTEPFKCYQRNKGASSVLVILMMVVLALFGLSALTASLATVRLTEKSGNWAGEYYLLEAEAEKVVAQLDKVLHDAESRAVGYMEEKGFLEETGTVLPADLQKIVYLSMTEYLPDSGRDAYLGRVMEAVYLLHAVNEIKMEFPGAELEYLDNIYGHVIEDEATSAVLFGITVSEETDENAKNIDLLIEIVFPGYSIHFAGNEVSGTRLSGGLRYNIVEWREWQEAFGYSEDIQYADPIRD